MTSKEALQKLKLLMFERDEDVRDINKNLVLLDVIEKDLEVLELLKQLLKSANILKKNEIDISKYAVILSDSTSEILKEWLRNE